MQVKAELEVHEDLAPLLITIYFWINEFKRVRTSVEDEACSGRPVENHAKSSKKSMESWKIAV